MRKASKSSAGPEIAAGGMAAGTPGLDLEHHARLRGALALLRRPEPAIRDAGGRDAGAGVQYLREPSDAAGGRGGGGSLRGDGGFPEHAAGPQRSESAESSRG